MPPDRGDPLLRRRARRGQGPLDLRGAVEALTPIELWLYLPTTAAERSACTATFRSPLNQGVAPLAPPTKLSPRLSTVHRPSVWFNSAPAPELVVEVTMDPDGGFMVTRQSIETGVIADPGGAGASRTAPAR